MEYGIFDERLGRSPEKIWLLPLEEREKRTKEIFKKKKGYELNLDDPQTYTEKLQWYKLYYHNPEIVRCIDKVEAKKYIAEKLGEGHTAKLIDVWESPDELSFDNLPDTFVLKSNCQDNGTYVNIVNGKNNYDLEKLKEEVQKYWFNPLNLLINGFCSGYYDVVPKVFAEEYIRDFSGQAANEYKFFCFDGVPVYCYATSNQIVNDQMSNPGEYELSFYAIDDWKRVDVLCGPHSKMYPPYYNAPKPYHFEEILDIARILSKGFPHVRVDFIDTSEKLFVGELTFYMGGGFTCFKPENFDKHLGSFFNLPQK